MKRCLALALLLAATPARAGDDLSMIFVGDILLDETPGQVIAAGEDPFASFAPALKAADFAVGNLECAVAEGGKAVEKIFTFRAHPRVLAPLASHFAVMGLANNHSGDFGPSALLETMDRLGTAGIRFFGAGKNLKDAHAPLVVERRGVRVALLGYDDFLPRWFEAGPDRPGVAWAEDEQILRDMRLARAAGADLVIPVIHWGWEHEPKPDARQTALARKLIDAGADAIVGGHPHVTQGAEVYRGKPIVYSLGNFLFDGFTSEAANTGWALILSANKRGVTRWHTLVATIDGRGVPRLDKAAPSPCGDAQTPAVRMCAAGGPVAPSP